jgi:hypothetical protein
VFSAAFTKINQIQQRAGKHISNFQSPKQPSVKFARSLQQELINAERKTSV